MSNKKERADNYCFDDEKHFEKNEKLIREHRDRLKEILKQSKKK